MEKPNLNAIHLVDLRAFLAIFQSAFTLRAKSKPKFSKSSFGSKHGLLGFGAIFLIKINRRRQFSGNITGFQPGIFSRCRKLPGRLGEQLFGRHVCIFLGATHPVFGRHGVALLPRKRPG